MSAVNGLASIQGELFLHEIRVPSVTITAVLELLLQFLSSIGEPCVMVAHNGTFDSTRLLLAIKQTNMYDAFKIVISGLVDTLPILRKKLQRHNHCNQAYLADEAEIPYSGAHDAVRDVEILQKIIRHHDISHDLLKSKKMSLHSLVSNEQLESKLK